MTGLTLAQRKFLAACDQPGGYPMTASTSPAAWTRLARALAHKGLVHVLRGGTPLAVALRA